MIRMIASDIDGTLLPEGTREMNPEMYPLIREMEEKDIVFVAASGRDIESIRTVFGPVAKDIIFMGNNGATIMCQDMDLFCKFIDRETCGKIIDFARELGNAHVVLASSESCYVGRESEEFISYLTDGYGMEPIVCEDLKKVKSRIVKVSLYLDGGDPADYIDAARKAAGSGSEAMGAGEHWLDFVGKNVNKGTGLAELQRRMGIRKEETISFGDNLNDIPMLKAAGRGYAVSTARTKVKEAAYEVLPEDRDAVMHKIMELVADHKQDLSGK